jgi:hypothetical protein
MELRNDRCTTAAEPTLPHARDRVPFRAAGAMARRTLAGALEQDGDVDAAVARYVRRARAEEVPVTEMLAGVQRIVAERFHTRAGDDDREHAVAAVVARALARYHRDD